VKNLKGGFEFGVDTRQPLRPFATLRVTGRVERDAVILSEAKNLKERASTTFRVIK